MQTEATLCLSQSFEKVPALSNSNISFVELQKIAKRAMASMMGS
jgi:hypothetical protein